MVASSCSGTPESGVFRAESVGNAGFLARHNGQIFAEGRSFSGNERDKVFVNDGAKTQEKRCCIVGARTGFGVELDRKARLSNHVQTFNGAVVGVDVSDLHLCPVLVRDFR